MLIPHREAGARTHHNLTLLSVLVQQIHLQGHSDGGLQQLPAAGRFQLRLERPAGGQQEQEKQD